MQDPCPCGGDRYGSCCAPLHRGERQAATAEQLMRSRYSAYALGEVEDIAIVAIPDAADLGNVDTNFVAHQALIAQCENLRYRIAVIDGPPNSSLNEIRQFGEYRTQRLVLEAWDRLFGE